MPDIPQRAVTLGGAAIERELLSGKDYTMWLDSDEALARVALEASAVILGEHVAAKILAHMEAHAPDDPGQAARARRLFGIAARVAARAFLTEEDEKQLAAAALTRMATSQNRRSEQ